MPARPANFLDFNSGVPLSHLVLEELLSLFPTSHQPPIGNPSSVHASGRVAKRLLADARDQVAGSLGRDVDPESLIFTSSGTEANQLAISSALQFETSNSIRPHWITTSVEHDSVMQMIERLRGEGIECSLLPVDQNGRPRVELLPSLIRPNTKLLSCIWVNNETGVINDIDLLAQVASSRGIPLHVDAAQAWGKIPIDVLSLGATYVTLSAHKIGGLPGTGVLWLKRGAKLSPVVLGKQEKGRRGGTENILGAMAAGIAAQKLDTVNWSAKTGELQDRFERLLMSKLAGMTINGRGDSQQPVPRVTNTTHLTFQDLSGESLVLALDLAGYCVSAGSACSSGALEPSHVLLAMGRSREEAMSSVRISYHPSTPWQVLEEFVMDLGMILTRLRQAAKPESRI